MTETQLSQQSVSSPWYKRCYRRMLVDMHIGDWDERLLSQYDPRQVAEMYTRAGVTSVMFYCQSHVGLCYWPTQSGKLHGCLEGRDVVAEMLTELQTRNIASCAYYSVVFNNWAFLEHPEWRIQAPGAGVDAAKDAAAFLGTRYGLVCPNNPDYRAFVQAQIGELLGAYRFESLFYDMTFWPSICLCPHCATRFRQEYGQEIPQTIDWFSPAWCAFQAARERWIDEFAGFCTDLAKGIQPGITVYHNIATLAFNWTLGLPASVTRHNDFLGGDFYGDPLDQLVVCKLLGNLTEDTPLEFMTSRCVNLGDHELTKSYDTLQMQALASTLFSAAFLFIDAINLDGTVNPPIYERIGRIYDEYARYEPYLGGEQVEDVAVYFSTDARVSFTENGLPLDKAPMWQREYPHLKAIRGACRVLQQAHLPFGVITRKQLPELSRYKVVVLPNVLRMDREEVEAFRAYVRNGGKLYASRYTSLVETSGTRHDDFLLADVFGCHLEADDLGTVTYLKPEADDITACVLPQRYLSHFGRPNTPQDGCGALRLSTATDGSILATLTVPYAKDWGSVMDRQWASIHSSPPFQETDAPVIIEHAFGQGNCIYSSADIECVEGEANDRLLLHLLMRLLGDAPSFSADTHPAAWMTVSHQPDRQRFLIGLLNYQAQLPPISLPRVPITLAPPPGGAFARLISIPDETPVPFTVDADGQLRAEVEGLEVLRMLVAEYRKC